MIRDLSNEGFDSSKTALGEQVGYLGLMTQDINNALIGECSSEFPNGFMKTKYSEINTLLFGKKNSNIEEMISLGKKSTFFSDLDIQSAICLDAITSETETMLQELNSKVNDLSASVSNAITLGLDAESLLSNLPEERANDIKNGNMFVSSDGKYMYYLGYAYEVYNPAIDNYNAKVVITSPGSVDWVNVHEQSYDKTYFDWWNLASATIQNIGENGDIEEAVAYNAPMVGYSILQAIADSRTDVKIDVMFQQNSNGDRRVIMGVYNSDYANIYNNFDYNLPYSTYDNIGVFKPDYMNKSQEIYEDLTGKKANEWAVYDVQYSLDERHRDERYQSYLSFDADGNLQETVNIYDGDKKEIVEREGFAGEIGSGEAVYTYDLVPTPHAVPDLYNEAIMGAINGGF